MGKSLIRKVKHEISVRLRPVSVLDFESLTKFLVDHERRLRRVENLEGFTVALNDRKISKTKTRKKKSKK